ncbi:hypothetical protein BXZ70DRAFT_910812 [Cristinia sonorae]|uniref:Uncharacterized protein n=1 Tax=Cristinia sonorae TaxID=1940300 RepID=A0A8K0UGW6_9AGAR|nr:hypothetical protein BXZ70DRAFT_910812 [Cristinia sonorae]
MNADSPYHEDETGFGAEDGDQWDLVVGRRDQTDDNDDGGILSAYGGFSACSYWKRGTHWSRRSIQCPVPVATLSGAVSKVSVQADNDSDEEMFDHPLVAEASGKGVNPDCQSDDSDDEDNEWLFGPPPITADPRAETDESDDGQFDMPVVPEAASSSSIMASPHREQASATVPDDDEQFEMPVVAPETTVSSALDDTVDDSDDEQFDLPVIADISSPPFIASHAQPRAASLVDDDSDDDEQFDLPVIPPGMSSSPAPHQMSSAESVAAPSAAGPSLAASSAASQSAAAAHGTAAHSLSPAISSSSHQNPAALGDSAADGPAARSSAVDSPGVVLLRGLEDRDAAHKIGVSTVELLDEIIAALNTTKQNRVGDRSQNGRDAISRYYDRGY